MKKIINSYRSIIFVNGIFSKELLDLLNLQVPIIAADGACCKLINLGVIPTYTVGDGDSSKNHDIIKIENQNYTDFEKCILFAKKKDILPSLTIGINGGEIDHILGNLQAILKHCCDKSLYFLDEYKNGLKLGIALKKEKLKIDIKKDSIISIVAFEKSVVNTKGLKWELKNKKIDLSTVLSIRNRNLLKSIEIEVKKGKVFVIIDVEKTFLEIDKNKKNL